MNINLKFDDGRYPKLARLMREAVNRPLALERALDRADPDRIGYWMWDYTIHDWRCSNCGKIHPSTGSSEDSGLTCPECGSLMIGSFLRRERDGDYSDR